MKSTLIEKRTTPPGGYRAKCPHCGMWTHHITWQGFEEAIRKHNKANQHPEWDYESQLCESLPPGFCRMEDGSISIGGDCRMNGASFVTGMESLGTLFWRLATGGEAYVDQAEADRRAAICAACPKNVNARGCANCGAMTAAKAVGEHITGPRRTAYDDQLENCCICLCSLKTIVHVQGDILKKGITEAQRRASPEFCWKLAL